MRVRLYSYRVLKYDGSVPIKCSDIISTKNGRYFSKFYGFFNSEYSSKHYNGRSTVQVFVDNSPRVFDVINQ